MKTIRRTCLKHLYDISDDPILPERFAHKAIQVLLTTIAREVGNGQLPIPQSIELRPYLTDEPFPDICIEVEIVELLDTKYLQRENV